LKRYFFSKINIVNISILPIIINAIRVNLGKKLKLKKSNSARPYIDELTVFIIASIPILKAFSKLIPEIESNDVIANKEIKKITIDKKYLLISVILVVELLREILFK